jgi:hypothetical protein
VFLERLGCGDVDHGIRRREGGRHVIVYLGRTLPVSTDEFGYDISELDNKIKIIRYVYIIIFY